MFTGLIEGLGEVVAVEKLGADIRLSIRPDFAFHNPVLGESVAVNGTCLTVETVQNSCLTFYASEETLSCSNISLLAAKKKVNLERALALGSRLGGHLVSGHIDTMGTVKSIQNIGQSRCITIEFAREWAKYIIPKGSVALDGISLTVNTCDFDFLTVNVIPETWKVTTIATWSKGQKINIETDMIGKYILRSQYLENNKPQKSVINEDFLRENGFF
jgi:riboflavin synthase